MPDGSGSARDAPPPARGGVDGGLSFSNRLPFILLGVGLFGVGLAFWRPVPAGVWHDDGVYLLIGKALSEGWGLRYLGVVGAPPAVKFPPAYPGVLAGLWWVFGSLRAVTIAAVLLNLALVATAGAALAWALHRAGGMSRWIAVVLTAVAFFSADVWRPALVTLSESLFLALAMGSLALWPEKGKEQPETRRTLLLSLLLAGTVMTRSAGMAVVVGFGVALFLARGWRLAVVTVAPALLTVAAWGTTAASRAATIPEGMRDVLGPYGSWLIQQLLTAPGAFLEVLPAQGLTLLGRVGSLLLPGVYGVWLWVLTLPLALLGLVGAVSLGRKLPPVPWVAGAYAALLLLWPFLDRRLVMPLHPLVAVCVGAGALEMASRRNRPALRRAFLAVAFLWVAVSASVTASRAARGWAVAGYQLRAGRLAAAVEALDRTAPDDAVVGAPEFWAALHLHGGWLVVPSARFTPRSADPDTPVWGTPDQQLALWWGAGVNHLLLEQGGQIHGEALNRIESRCPGDVQVLARLAPQILVRLDWGVDCARRLGLRPRMSGSSD